MFIMVIGWAFIVLAFANLIIAAVDIVSVYQNRRLPEKTEGVIIGFVHHIPPQRYDKHGEVPDVAYKYWGRTTGNALSAFSSLYQALTAWAWHPCVRFTTKDGEEKAWIPILGSKKDAWTIGQSVQVRYDPASAAQYSIEGDKGPSHAVRSGFLWAAVFALIGVVLLILSYNPTKMPFM